MNFEEHAKLAVRQLHSHPIAKVEFPNEDKMQQFLQLLNICEPTITDVQVRKYNKMHSTVATTVIPWSTMSSPRDPMAKYFSVPSTFQEVGGMAH
jgi:hypothetical protein